MPDLYVSLLGAPYRAVVAQANGQRAFVKIGDRQDNDFALDPLVWIDQEGAVAGVQAALLERAGHFGECVRVRIGSTTIANAASGADGPALIERDILAVIIRRFLGAAEAQSGESIGRVICVVPPNLDASVREGCAQAALLAGAAGVEIVTPELACTRAKEILIEAWDDCARLTVLDATLVPRTLDLGEDFSKSRLIAKLGEGLRFSPGVSANLHAEVTLALFEQWASGKNLAKGASITRAVARAAPVSAYVPKSAFDRLDAIVSDALTRALGRALLAPGDVTSARVIGSWTRPISTALKTLCGATAIVRDDRGLELDAAVALVPPRSNTAAASLSSDILAIAQTARTLRALSQGEPVSLLRAGTRLPATCVSENFASNSFIDTFWLAAKNGPEPAPMLQLAIPRYAERQSGSYLRAVVHCDTPSYLFLEVAYLYPSRRRFAFFDKARNVEIPVSDQVCRLIRG